MGSSRVTHPFATRPLAMLPLRRTPFDLHVLSTPPAFVLSQDQTLRRRIARTRRVNLGEPVDLATDRTCTPVDTEMRVIDVAAPVAFALVTPALAFVCPLFRFQGALARRHMPPWRPRCLPTARVSHSSSADLRAGRERTLSTGPESVNSVGPVFFLGVGTRVQGVIPGRRDGGSSCPGGAERSVHGADPRPPLARRRDR